MTLQSYKKIFPSEPLRFHFTPSYSIGIDVICWVVMLWNLRRHNIWKLTSPSLSLTASPRTEYPSFYCLFSGPENKEAPTGTTLKVAWASVCSSHLQYQKSCSDPLPYCIFENSSRRRMSVRGQFFEERHDNNWRVTPMSSQSGFPSSWYSSTWHVRISEGWGRVYFVLYFSR